MDFRIDLTFFVRLRWKSVAGLVTNCVEPHVRRTKVVKSITDPFQELDPVVVALADAVGFVIFPGVLYISTPVADHVCNMAYFRNFRRAVNLETFGQLCALESRYGHVVDVMETLECLPGDRLRNLRFS